MRIISGKYKGRRITAPKKLPIRPTTDMAKEALFNILNNSYYFEDLEVLDLFAGSGNISYEFGSRGATKIVSVDANFRCIKFISATATALELEIEAVKSDVFAYLEKTTSKFDIIFADPPYDLSPDKFAEIPKLTFDRALLQEGGVLVIEHSKHTDLSHLHHFTQQRKYGGSVFSFFEAAP
ncbi:16S rRNA (guanine(966)-N(2))-methyltransferase RsmD [Muriicola sp. Z0-33]|uniref:16S rRNA (guanine(966)-N(2))-methyltransferase RsmD n=1 Tax=Muriicola sp. Z0-33 TaxID=2816957 RepID=UPI002237B34F|nr:16S rRNA (guanine(966)-N(2))-methyltransferase RsmD [Muriicola sp. Z0-33]MCW5517447.1 16S rRNA (guanine(966)-N(2))-methyltransferase RsmD [Muriicola sp. Z0-33]